MPEVKVVKKDFAEELMEEQRAPWSDIRAMGRVSEQRKQRRQ